MSRNNGTFKYKPIQEAVKDPTTGLYSAGDPTAWLPGCECQIDKFVPAKQKIGADGIIYTYSYDVFLPKHFDCSKFSIGTKVQLYSENGMVGEFTIQGIDDLNRKYVELWG